MSTENKGQNKTYVLAVLIVLIGAVIGVLLIVMGGESEPELTQEEVTQILDEGTCTEQDAVAIANNAEAQEDAYESALAYEELANCYIQTGNSQAGSEAAQKSADAYYESGNPVNAEQMLRAKELFDETTELQNSQPEEGEEPEVINGDAV